MLRIVPHTVPRVGRSYEHFQDGLELHLLLLVECGVRAWNVGLGSGILVRDSNMGLWLITTPAVSEREAPSPAPA